MFGMFLSLSLGLGYCTVGGGGVLDLFSLSTVELYRYKMSPMLTVVSIYYNFHFAHLTSTLFPFYSFIYIDDSNSGLYS
jgi:hypothetical protein